MSDSDDILTPTSTTPAKRRINRAYLFETGWLAAGTASKLLIQMGTLYYLTATLGRDGVGSFFAVVGLLACLVPFVQLGNYDLTIRAIARREDPQRVAGRAMRTSVAAFVALVPVLLALRLVFAKDISWTAFLVVATGELLVMRVMTNVQAVATGFRLHYVVAICDFALGCSRFAAVYVASRWHAGVNLMLILYAFTSLPASVGTYVWLVRRIGRPAWRGGVWFEHFADHRRMLFAWFAEMAASQGDKPLLKALATAGDVGIYGTASKLFAVVIVPVDLLTQVFRPRIGQAYADGADRGASYARKVHAALVAFGAIAGIGLFAVAWSLPWLAPRLANSAFGEARVALMYLAILPPIYGLQRAQVITSIARGGTGAYAHALTISAAAGLTTLALTAPRLGWRGACLAYGVYTLTSAATLWHFGRRGATPTVPTTNEPEADLGLAAA